MTVLRAQAIGGLVFVATVLSAFPASAGDRQATAPTSRTDPDSTATELAVAPAGDTSDATHQSAHGPSQAERIARLDRSLRSDEKRLGELKASLNDPAGEHREAETEFGKLDEQLIDKKDELKRFTVSGSAQNADQVRGEVTALEKKWALARDRLDLAIRERKATQESIVALEQKLQQDRQTLEELRGGSETEETSHASSADKPHDPDHGVTDSVQPATRSSHELPAGPTAARTLLKTAPASVHAKPTEADVLGVAVEPNEGEPKELVAATAAAHQTEVTAEMAEHKAQSISERIETLRKNIALARRLRETARQQVDNADATLKGLNEELFRKLMEGANTDSLKQQIKEATDRVREARTESREVTTHLDDLQSSLNALQAEQLAAAADANQKRDVAEQAAAVVKELHNPFSVHNLSQWLLDHGPRICGILLALATCLHLSRVLEGRLVLLVANRGRIGNREERENRAKTLLGIFHNAANIVIVGGGVVMVLDEVGIPVAPLIGGAAVVGLAVAFGAQSLIKDYFTGFLVLLEQQYLINDVIKIGEITGQVERITLRTTVLRDLEGRVHFIPHGQISTVTNTTHGWSRAVFEIRVAYRENIDRAIAVLMDLAQEMRASDAYRPLILDEPVMLGVDALSDSGVVLKFHIKTRPLQQWVIKRELLRRIKNKFDELGIEMPFPQLMIHRRDDDQLTVVADGGNRRAG